MVTTVSQLIERAARSIGELQANQSIDADTLSTVLWPIARDWLNGLPGHVTGTGETMFEQTVSGANTLYGGNVRLTCAATCTATLPPAPRDGWRIVVADLAAAQVLTLARNGKKIAGAAADATPAAGGEYLYRADLGSWNSPLVAAVSDAVPWPDEFIGGLAAMLAIEIQPVLGLPIKPDTRLLAAAEESRMVQRYYRKNPLLARGMRYQMQMPQPVA